MTRIRIATDHPESIPMTPEQFARDAVESGLPETCCPYAPGTANCRLFLREYRALLFAKQAVAEGRIAQAEEAIDAAAHVRDLAERCERDGDAGERPSRFRRVWQAIDRFMAMFLRKGG